MSYQILLEYILKSGLSPSSASVINGLIEFFRHAFYEAANGNQEHLIEARDISHCLKSEEYKIVAASALLLRKFINSTYEVPKNCIENLIHAKEKSAPTAARQAALTLGCLGCTKPSRGLQPQGIRPLLSRDAILCLNCGAGYDRRKNTVQIVPVLIRNLNLPKYKDKSRNIRRASSIALGVIGYQNPEAILDALALLRECLRDEKSVSDAVFALGCVGFTRPDLVEDLIPAFEKSQSLACRNALLRIGMETGTIVDDLKAGKRSLSDTMEIFFERMKEYEGGLVDTSIEAILELSKTYPEEVLIILNKKLVDIRKDKKDGNVAQNISYSLLKLSEHNSTRMKDCVPLLLESFRKGSFESYRTLDYSALVLKKLFQTCPEFIPKNTIEKLETFLESEKRGSVISNTKDLIEEIKKH